MSFDLTCEGCGAILPCQSIPDDLLYSLENPTFPYILECLGNNCQMGPIIYFACCNQLLQAPVPVGSSSGQILSILNSLAAQCFNLQSACGEFPAFPPGTFPTPNNPINLFFNQSQTCKLICPDGNPFTYTVPAGWVVAITQAKANAAAYSIACAKAKASRFCLSNLSPVFACGGIAYSATISANGPVVTPCTWSIVSGSLPPGLTLGGFSPNVDTTLGPTETIQGTPTTGGSYTFTLRCEGGDFSFMDKTYTICVANIQPSSLPAGTVGTAYSQSLTENSGCLQTPLAWTVSAGSIPPGLAFAPSGTINGTPTTPGDYAFTVKKTSGSKSCTRDYTIHIASACDVTVATLHCAALYAYWLANAGSNLWNGDYANAGTPPPSGQWCSPQFFLDLTCIQFNGITLASSLFMNVGQGAGPQVTYNKAAAVSQVNCFLGTYTLASWNGLGGAPPGTVVVTL